MFYKIKNIYLEFQIADERIPQTTGTEELISEERKH